MSADSILGRTDELAVIDGFLAGPPGDSRLLVISGARSDRTGDRLRR